MTEPDPYMGPERRVHGFVPAAEVQRLTEQVSKLIDTNSSLDSALRDIAAISERQVEMEETAAKERALVRARWNRDNLIVGLLVLIFVGFAVVIHRQQTFSANNTAQIREQEQQRLTAIIAANDTCNNANRDGGNELRLLQGLVPDTTGDVQKLVQSYIAVFPAPRDCSVYPPQIKSLQDQLGHG